jgi:hypothetical protein
MKWFVPTLVHSMLMCDSLILTIPAFLWKEGRKKNGLWILFRTGDSCRVFLIFLSIEISDLFSFWTNQLFIFVCLFVFDMQDEDDDDWFCHVSCFLKTAEWETIKSNGGASEQAATAAALVRRRARLVLPGRVRLAQLEEANQQLPQVQAARLRLQVSQFSPPFTFPYNILEILCPTKLHKYWQLFEIFNIFFPIFLLHTFLLQIFTTNFYYTFLLQIF